MIDRYTRPEMGHIFSLENKYAIWQEIEVLACEAQAELGNIGITREEAQWIRDHARFNKDEVDAIEAVTNHDVIAFLTNMGEYIDAEVPEGEPKPSRWVHFGMTSSDLGDTALCYQLVQATDILIEDVQKLGVICKRRAFEERNTLCAGRTHGIHAEPMTFGMKFGSWAWGAQARPRPPARRPRQRRLWRHLRVRWAPTPPSTRLWRSTSASTSAWCTTRWSTQVISRDHHAYLAGVLATTAATCERHCDRDPQPAEDRYLGGRGALQEGVRRGRAPCRTSRNPITMEKVCGLSRVVKANAQVAFDNVALWHERDISHSSAERVAQADSFIALDHMFQCLIRVVDGLILYPEQMLANLNKTRGLIFSSKVLLALVGDGHHARGGLRHRAGETPWPRGARCSSAPAARPSVRSSRRTRAARSRLRSSTRSSIRGTSSRASTASSIVWRSLTSRSALGSLLCKKPFRRPAEMLAVGLTELK